MYEHCKTCTHDDGGIGWCDKCVYTIFHRKTGLPPTEYERLEEPKPVTNADRIRSMADEKLAEFAVSTGQGCAPGKNFVECCFDHKDGLIEADCRKCWLEWLKQEVVSDG